MKSYVDDIVVTDKNGEKAILYPNTKQEAVEGLLERLSNAEKPDITETTSPTMPNSYNGRLLVEKIGGGESKQFCTAGNQLFDVSNYPLTEGYYINGSDGTQASNASYACTGFVPCDKWQGKTLTLNKRPGGVYPGIAFYSDKNATAFVSGVANNSSASGKPITFSVPTNATFLRFTVPANSTEIMLNEGSESLPYEPYTGGIPSPNPSYPQEIKKAVVSEIRTHGKNFLDISHFAIGSWGQDGKPTSNLTNGRGTKDIIVKPNTTYHFSANQNILAMRLSEYDSAGNHIKRSASNNADFIKIVTTENTRIIRWSLNYDNTQDVTWDLCKSFDLMIVEGDERGTYEPYTESTITLSQPIELYGIGDVQDVIDIEHGKIVRVSNNLKLTSSLNWGVSSSTPKRYTLNRTIKSGVAPLCSHYRGGKGLGTAPLWTNGGVQFVFDTEFDTFDEWMTFIDSNDVQLLYELATPTEEDLPLADQIALNSLSTYDGITYLGFDSEIEPTFKGEYGTSKVGGYTLEGMLAGRNGELYGKDYNSRLSALETSVVNNI